jgi:hypothetical protein
LRYHFTASAASRGTPAVLGVHEPEAVLGGGVTPLGGFAVPLHGLGDVMRYASTLVMQPAKVVLGVVITNSASGRQSPNAVVKSPRAAAVCPSSRVPALTPADTDTNRSVIVRQRNAAIAYSPSWT